jgi:hypothetical protein
MQLIAHTLVILLTPPTCFGPIGHLQGRHLQMNAFIIKVFQDLHNEKNEISR